MAKKKAPENLQFYVDLGKGKKRHRIRVRSLRIEKTFLTQREALTFRDGIVATWHDVELLMQTRERLSQYVIKGQPRLADLYDKLTPEDYAYICKEATVHNAIRAKLRPDAEMESEDVQVDANMTLAEAVSYYRQLMDGRGKLINQDETYYRFWGKENPIRKRPISDLNHLLISNARMEYVQASDRRTNVAGNAAVKFLARVIKTVNRDLTQPVNNPAGSIAKLDREKGNSFKRSGAYERDELKVMFKFWRDQDQLAMGSNYHKPVITFVSLFIRLALATALRKTSLMTLRWDEIKYDRKETRYYVQKLTKESRDEESTVYLTNQARAILEEIKKHPMPKMADPSLRKVWVFPSVSAAPRTHDHAAGIDQRFVDLSREAGLRLTHKPMHGFRSTVATWMAEAGKSEGEIAAVLSCTVENVKHYVVRAAGLKAASADGLSQVMEGF